MRPNLPASESESRRPYSRPRLAVYGDLREVTLSSLTNAMNDKTNSSQTMT